MNKYMVLAGGSPALHKLGNIGRKEDDYIRVFSEDESHYIGNFAEGFGFIDVKFRKDDCRNLTEDEVVELNGKWFCINNNPLIQVVLDCEGNVVKR